MRKGVYFVANDAVLDLVIAFLNSFRHHNRDLPLCFIPFDAASTKVEALSDSYKFTVFADSATLNACDAISTRFHDRTMGHYRKLAIWEGPFDEFIYIDVDTVLLSSLDFVYGVLTSFPILTSHSHLDGIVRWVWKKSIWSQPQLTKSQVSFAANTGFIASRRGVLSVAHAQKSVASALPLRRHMVLACKEQPFLNYLIVTSGVRYSSLRVLADSMRRAGVSHGVKLEHWAGNRHAVVSKGTARRLDNPTPLLLMHWAGQWQPTWRDRWVFRSLHSLGLTSASEHPCVRRRMPYRDLWTHYRTMPLPVTSE